MDSTDFLNVWYNGNCQDTYTLCYHVNRTLGAASACPGRPAQQAAPGVLFLIQGLPTMRCKSCLKCYHAVNEHGICARCQEFIDRSKFPIVFQQSSANKMIPYKGNGRLLTRAEWTRFKRWIDNYYTGVSDEEIEAYNAQVAEQRASRPQNAQAGYIYLLESSVGYYKIGKAADVEKRLGQHLRDYPVRLAVIHTIWVPDRHKTERYLLKLFADKRMQGEWFDLDADDVQWLKSLTSNNLMRLVK